MRRTRKILKRLLYVLLFFVGLLVILFVYLFIVAIDRPPKPIDTSALELERSEPSPGLYTIKDSWFRQGGRLPL